MSTPALTRAQVDRAGVLNFDQPRSARSDLTITIRATIDGFDTEVCYTGSIEQLLAVTKRLRELGAEPVSAHKPAVTSPAVPQRAKVETVEPEYKPNGTPCCPVHHGALAEGQYGWYCRSKAKPGDVQNAKSFCALKFDL